MKLLVLDVEGTVFETTDQLPGTSLSSTIWQGLARKLGPHAIQEEVETHRLWQEGRYRSYLDWMKATISIHQRHGLTREMFQDVVTSARYADGIVDVFSVIDRRRFEAVLVSGGFRELAARAQRDLYIRHAFAACEYLFDDSNGLVGFNLLPCDFEGKLDFIHLMLREYKLGSHDWVFVGDGANDVPVARQAPVSVGYRPHPELAAVVTHSIHHFTELPSILSLADTVDD